MFHLIPYCKLYLPIALWKNAEPRSYILLCRIPKEGRKCLFNNTLNTFYLQLYGIRYMVKDHSDSEKGNPLPPHRLLFPINSKGSFICLRQDNIYHSLCYTSRGALAGMRNRSMSPPWGINPMTHHTMSRHPYHGAASHYAEYPWRLQFQQPTKQWQWEFMLEVSWTTSFPPPISFVQSHTSSYSLSILRMSYYNVIIFLCHFYQAAIAIKISNWLICFCSFDLSCPIL